MQFDSGATGLIWMPHLHRHSLGLAAKLLAVEAAVANDAFAIMPLRLVGAVVRLNA